MSADVFFAHDLLVELPADLAHELEVDTDPKRVRRAPSVRDSPLLEAVALVIAVEGVAANTVQLVMARDFFLASAGRLSAWLRRTSPSEGKLTVRYTGDGIAVSVEVTRNDSPEQVAAILSRVASLIETGGTANPDTARYLPQEEPRSNA